MQWKSSERDRREEEEGKIKTLKKIQVNDERRVEWSCDLLYVFVLLLQFIILIKIYI